jgi:hypothetical protein
MATLRGAEQFTAVARSSVVVAKPQNQYWDSLDVRRIGVTRSDNVVPVLSGRITAISEKWLLAL